MPALLLFSALAIVFTFPLVLHLGSAVTDPVDPLLNTWILAWDHHALLTEPGRLLDANIFHPRGEALLYSETLLLPGVLLFPVGVAVDDPLLVYNLFVLLGYVSTAAGGYLLGRWLTRSPWGGLAVGLVLAFNSYTVSVLPKAQLLHLGWLPLALLYTGRTLRRPGRRNTLLLALYLAAQFYTTIYYGFFAFLLVGLVAAAGWLGRAYSTPAVRWRGLLPFAGATLLAIFLCLPLAWPYYHLSERYGLVRTLADTWPFAASLDMWRTPPAATLLYGWLPAPERPRVGYYPVEALFPGFLLLALALLGLGTGGGKWGGRRFRLLVAAGTAFFFLLSLGPFLQVESLRPDHALTLPYAWLHGALPGFTALRAPARFASLVYLGLGLLAAVGLTRLNRLWLRGGVVALLFVEALAVPTGGRAGSAGEYSAPAEPTGAHRWLADQPPGVALELPAYYPQVWDERDAGRWLEAQYLSTRHWQPTPAGYSGFVPPRHPELIALLNRFPEAGVVTLLQAMGVDWLLLRPARFSGQRWQEIERAITAAGWRVERWPDAWLVSLPAGGDRRVVQHVVPPDRARAGDGVEVTVVYTSEGTAAIPPGSALGRWRVIWRGSAGEALSAAVTFQPPFVVDSLALATVSVPVPDRPGRYRLRVMDGGGVGELAAAEVEVLQDVAPPELSGLPLAPEEVELLCGETEPALRLRLRTIGWYDAPVTLSARLLAESGEELGRSAVDVEFPAHLPRTELLSTHVYALPLAACPQEWPALVELSAYRWQQAAERTVPRLFVTEDGELAPRLRVRLAGGGRSEPAACCSYANSTARTRSSSRSSSAGQR